MKLSPTHWAKFLMELLLNLAWLLLMVPAFLLWRSSRSGSGAHKSSFVLLVLACTLTILFPVVSASDDIQAMRPEIEEASSRDAISNPHNSRLLASLPQSSGGSALLIVFQPPQPEFRDYAGIVPLQFTEPETCLVRTSSGRAPPAALLT